MTFDLFGTLLTCDPRRMPKMVIDGAVHRTLLAAPLIRLTKLRPDIDLAEAFVAYALAVAEARDRIVGSEHRELPARWTFVRCLRHLGLADEALADALQAAFNAATLAAARPVGGAGPLLHELRARGYAIGLVSNLADVSGADALISAFRLDRSFEAVVFSGDVGWRKPSARIFATAVRALGLPPDAVLHVGDELQADVCGAAAAGLGTVWINPSGMACQSELRPHLEVRSLEAVGEWALL